MSKSTATTTPCCSKVGIKKGPWSAEEDEILSKFVQKEGEGRWRTLPKRAGLQRCGKSCRLRWMNYLRPSVKRGQIAPDEEDLILRLHRLLGNRWALIAGRLPGRTDNEIKNYWNTHLSKKLIKRGIDPRTHKPLITTNYSTTPVTTSNGGVFHHHHQHSNVITSSIIMPLQHQPTMTVNPASEIGNVNNSKFDYAPIISAGGNIMEENNNNNNNVVVDYHHHGGNNGNNNNDVEEEDTLLVFLNSLFDGGNNEVMNNNNNNNNNDNSGTDELAVFQHHHDDEGDVTMFPPPLSTSFRLEDWEAEFSNALINQQDGSSSSSPPNK
ncbi:hypothetical protein HN51_016431 [Arachis hypogaea]|uniref:Uncharacterized protein n=1 Tax=Arachis hypogaea TaxID=3818 RepID=A0A445CSP5_ARAHY|nr:transcription factor MYB3-like [Arachis hypogaea]QHO46995.1 Transcription repressor [Arachis hypogaea]RYR53960.1 hypothetical protein Ahy_A06g029207 isoform A [Arachis hypogaea]